jgi:hypothetical protein
MFESANFKHDFSPNIEKWTLAELQKALNLQIGLHPSRILRLEICLKDCRENSPILLRKQTV